MMNMTMMNMMMMNMTMRNKTLMNMRMINIKMMNLTMINMMMMNMRMMNMRMINMRMMNMRMMDRGGVMGGSLGSRLSAKLLPGRAVPIYFIFPQPKFFLSFFTGEFLSSFVWQNFPHYFLGKTGPGQKLLFACFH